MKELYRTGIKKELKDVKIGEDKLELVFEDESIILESHHPQDCCEHVYADFSVVKNYLPQIETKLITNLVISGVKDAGFILALDTGEHYTSILGRIFIPCYNSQNGYYSSDLSLEITKGDNGTIKVDISEYVEDDIG